MVKLLKDPQLFGAGMQTVTVGSSLPGAVGLRQRRTCRLSVALQTAGQRDSRTVGRSVLREHSSRHPQLLRRPAPRALSPKGKTSASFPFNLLRLCSSLDAVTLRWLQRRPSVRPSSARTQHWLTPWPRVPGDPKTALGHSASEHLTMV